MLKQNIVARANEIEAYEVNIFNYRFMLEELPKDEWPLNIAHYQNSEVPYDAGMEVAQLVSDYQFRDKLRRLLRSELLEQSKSMRVKRALEAQLEESCGKKTA